MHRCTTSRRALATAALAITTIVAGACGAAQQEPDLTAEQVVAQIAQRVPEAQPSVVFTAETDPNDLLGRPDGYTSKAAFTDTRLDSETLIGFGEGDVEVGGSVEVFDSEDAARARMDYIQAVTGSASMFGSEYDYVRGPVLLRVTGKLTPDQVAAYETALSEIES